VSEPSFPPTQPLPEYQARLPRKSAARGYFPNHVHVVARVTHAFVALTWTTWAVIGILSGHMFFLISRGGPVHFSGVPAFLFSAAVMACAATSVLAIVDHYDRRNNEASYKRLRKRLWLVAAALLLLAMLVGLAERTDALPLTDGSLGLLSTLDLQNLLASQSLSSALGPHKDALYGWSVGLGAWCVLGVLLLSKLKLIREGEPARPGIALFMLVALVGPALFSFTLALGASLVTGSMPSARPMVDDAIRAQVAWMHSMFLACVSLSAFWLLSVTGFVAKAAGVLPEPKHREHDASQETPVK
jgi:hypothetical protein